MNHELKYKEYLIIAITIKIGSYLLPLLIGYLWNSPDQLNISSSSLLINLIGNSGFGYWLYKESRNCGWLLMGLISSTSGVILFYLLQLMNQHDSKL